MSDKFQKTIEELAANVFPKIREILIVFLYGSVKRGDHCQRHSDLDLFVVLKKKAVPEKLKEKIDQKIFSAGYKFGVKAHPEYQGLEIKPEDRTLVRKMIEEGKIIYSAGVFTFDNQLVGLKQFIIYDFSLKGVERKTIFSKVLHGRKSWYLKGKVKVVKEYPGIIDNEGIIQLGKGVLMASQEKQKDLIDAFEKYGIKYRLRKIVYG